MLCLCLLPACGDSNGDEPDNPNPINPDKEVADPAGTVKLSMRSEAAVGDSKTTINNGLWIDAADNFYAHRGYIVNLGSMKGLGNVGYIPKTGYVETVAVTPGDGYIWATEGYNEFGNYERNTFYRIYVTNYTQNTSGEIIGADIKYQKPFYGKDEALKPSDTNLSVSGDGGEASVVFENNSVIPFVVESDKDWVRPSISSTLDHSFLPNAITFYIDPATTTESETATVTATTTYDKSTTITITRLGVAPKLSIPDDAANKEIDANATEYRIPITTNLDFNDLTVKSSADWATVELVDGSSRTAAIANSIRWIGNEPATHSRANTATVRTYYALVKVAANVNSAERNASITVSSKDGKLSAKHSLSQKGATISVTNISIGAAINDNDVLKMGNTGGAINISIKSSNKSLKVSSDSSWATISESEEKGDDQLYTITIDPNDNTDERTAKISIKGKSNEPSMSFSITQSPATIEVYNVTTRKQIEDGSTIEVSELANTIELNVVSSNSNIKLTSNASWCTATMTNQDRDYTYYTIAAADNETTESRTAKIKIKSEKGDVLFSFAIHQSEGKLRVKLDGEYLDGSTTKYIDKNGQTFNYEIVGSLPFKVKSNAEWCSVYQSGKNIAIIISKTDIIRSTSIEISGGEKPIIITYKQTKYTNHQQIIDQTIDANLFINFETGKTLLYKKVKDFTIWSKQQIATGATSLTDGEANTNKIHSIPNWEENYPAFVAVNTLNTGKNSGWYMPARDEFGFSYMWTSTELDKNSAFFLSTYGNSYTNKTSSNDGYHGLSVYAVKKFNAFDVEDNE